MKALVARAVQGSVNLVPLRVRRQIKNIPIARYVQHLLIKHFLQDATFLHTINSGPAKGLRYPVTMPNDKLIWTGTYELELAQRIRAAIAPNSICLDIGGYRGFFSGVMALAGARRVWVFEPFPRNVTQIRLVLQENPRLPISLLELAIAESDGETEFAVMPEASMGKLSASLFQPESSLENCA